MRADRLLSLLLLLQARGKLTAEELAGELEVSVRTVYRDMEALSAAGVPVYADRGPGGGVALLDNYRTHLTGLHADEVRALFMAEMPAALTELGFGGELKTAMLKLLAALPGERQGEEQWVRQRVLLDWERAGEDTEAAESTALIAHLRTIQAAVWADRRIRITYRRESSFYRRQFTRLVDPYGLVAWAGIWHLVCAADGRMRVYPVQELSAVTDAAEPFTRASGFDLPSFWRQWRQAQHAERGQFVVLAHVSPAMAAELPLHLDAARVEFTGSTDADGWQEVQLRFDGLGEARTKLLGLGAGVEVRTPAVLRLSMLDYAQQVVQLYSRH